MKYRGLTFDGDAQVYPPKPASLLLADTAMNRIQPGERVLDMCTGSGVVGIVVAKFVRDVSVTLSDINENALATARRNAKKNNLHAEVISSSLYDQFPDEMFDTITVHPPAVPYPEGQDWGMSSGMRTATHGGIDGSELVVSSIAEARRCLKPHGKLLLLLPHWSNREKAWSEFWKHYANVREIAKKRVEFFPVSEGKPDARLLQHIKALAEAGTIEMNFDNEVPTSYVSVIEGRKP